jgi:2,5-dihydroxypyridine 5,6-dioxygenase
MESVLMTRGAGRILDVCAGLKPGEQVVVVTDFLKSRLAEIVAAAAADRGAEVTMVAMPPRKFDGAEPTPAAGGALSHADLIVSLVAQSITHSTAIKNAIQGGARGIMLSAFISDQLMGGGIDADFNAIAPLCHRVSRLLGEATEARLTTPAGTDLTMSLTGRPGNAHTGLAHSGGQFTTVPNIEASVSPVEGTAQGMFVADASIPYYGIGLLSEPITYEVSNGVVVNIEGGRQASQISAMMASAGDPAVYNIAQLSFGLNPLCRMRGVMLDDEGVYGTSHIGIGTSTSLGGTIKAAMHYDALMWRPTLELDGRTVLKDGVWLLEEAQVIEVMRVVD